MDEEKWRLQIAETLGELKAEVKNNTLLMQEVKKKLGKLPCTEHAKIITTLRTKLSKPYIVGAIVIWLIPLAFLFYQMRDVKIVSAKESKRLEKVIKNNGNDVKKTIKYDD